MSHYKPLHTGCPKKMSFSGKTAITTFKLIQNAKVGGVFWKIQDIYYTMDTEIFKIEEETTEKIKPPVHGIMGRRFPDRGLLRYRK